MAIRRMFGGVPTYDPGSYGEDSAGSANSMQAMADAGGFTNESNGLGRAAFWNPGSEAPMQALLGLFTRRKMEEEQTAENERSRQKNMAGLLGIRMQTQGKMAEADATRNLETWKKQGDWAQKDSSEQAMLKRYDEQNKLRASEGEENRQARKAAQDAATEAKGERQQAILDQKKAEAQQRKEQAANADAEKFLGEVTGIAKLDPRMSDVAIERLTSHTLDPNVTAGPFQSVRDKAAAISANEAERLQNIRDRWTALVKKDPKLLKAFNDAATSNAPGVVNRGAAAPPESAPSLPPRKSGASRRDVPMEAAPPDDTVPRVRGFRETPLGKYAGPAFDYTLGLPSWLIGTAAGKMSERFGDPSFQKPYYPSITDPRSRWNDEYDVQW